MTQDEIIEMAQECGLIGMRPHLDGIYSEALEAFAKLVAEKEREAWKNAAIRLGEELSSVGPDGYYNMTAEQWLDWAMNQQPRGKNSLSPPQRTEQKPVAWMEMVVANLVREGVNKHKARELAQHFYTHPPQRTEQKMVMWPCLIDTADFSKGTVTIAMQCEDYKVSAGTHWLSTTPPQRTWVGLTDDDKVLINHDANFNQFMTAGEYADIVQQLTEARLKDLNT